MKIDDLIGNEPLSGGERFQLPDGDILVISRNPGISAADIAALYSEDMPQWLKDQRAEAEKNGDNY